MTADKPSPEAYESVMPLMAALIRRHRESLKSASIEGGSHNGGPVGTGVSCPIGLAPDTKEPEA
jgi:hypothetical protein